MADINVAVENVNPGDKNGDYYLDMTGFIGHEAEVLQLRNANRETHQNIEFIEWRFAEPGDGPQPKIYWLRTRDGLAVGMVAVIFRRYWINGKLEYLSVIGDISLDAALRGRGLGRLLLEHMTVQICQDRQGRFGLVLPNKEAQHCLSSIGWKNGGQFVDYVCPLKVSVLPMPGWVRGFVERLSWSSFKPIIKFITRMWIPRGYSFQLINGPDSSFDLLWQEVRRKELVLRDRSLAVLTWRYAKHPYIQFQFVRLALDEKTVGYLVYTQHGNEVTIYDALVRDDRMFPILIRFLLLHCLSCPEFSKVRITLHQRHPYGLTLWRLGFFRRFNPSKLQFVRLDRMSDSACFRWALTAGDKDV